MGYRGMRTSSSPTSGQETLAVVCHGERKPPIVICFELASSWRRFTAVAVTANVVTEVSVHFSSGHFRTLTLRESLTHRIFGTSVLQGLIRESQLWKKDVKWTHTTVDRCVWLMRNDRAGKRVQKIVPFLIKNWETWWKFYFISQKGLRFLWSLHRGLCEFRRLQWFSTARWRNVGFFFFFIIIIINL